MEDALTGIKREKMQELVVRLRDDPGVQSIHSIVATGKPNMTRLIVRLDDTAQIPTIPDDLLKDVSADVTYITSSGRPPTDSQRIYERPASR